MQRLSDLVNKIKTLDYDSLFYQYRYLILVSLLGLILIGVGVFYAKGAIVLTPTKVEVLSSTTESQSGQQITIEIAGAVEKPGVYQFKNGSRIEDALVNAGGLSAVADRVWVEKTLNRAAKLTDGQKVYIPSVTTPNTQQSTSGTAKNSVVDQTISTAKSTQTEGKTNINTAALSELDKLPGIGPVYGQSIIDHRPYSTIEELVSTGALKKSVFEKIKDKISVY